MPPAFRQLAAASVAWLLIPFASPFSARADETATEVHAPTPEQLEFFEKQVRPVLIARCYECHSAGAKKIEAGLRVDSRAALLAGGDSGPAIVPGQAEESELVSAVRYESFEMPPKGKLPEAEIAALTEWVAMGAPWPVEEDPAAAGPAKPKFDLAARKAEHWSWQPVGDPAVPAVQNEFWPRDTVDRFLLAKLEEAKLAPAPEANRRTYIRRLWFDLLGLPPTAEEIAAFVEDDSPDAYEQLVDRALASPRFGERWGRHWLDLVRYAESRGHEFDNDALGAYRYRDYVIRALNADVPYDRFVVEHLAGDLVETPRLDPWGRANQSILGTGFYHLGEWVHSPVDVRKDENDRFDNMIDVTTKTFLGLTVACARCHDHKFDAISTTDYYSLAGFLQSSDYRETPFESLETNRAVAKELADLDRQTRQALRTSILEAAGEEASATRISAYLMAVREVWNTRQEVSAADAQAVEAATDRIAARHGVDRQRLAKWTVALEQAAEKRDPLFGSWKALSQAEGSSAAVQATAEAPASASRLIVDYATCDEAHFLQDGFSFGAEPLRRGDLRLGGTPDSPTIEPARYGAAVRDPAWNGFAATLDPKTNEQSRVREVPQAGRTLRTPTFELTTGKLSILARGAARAFVVVDSHRLVFGPLHGETLFDFDHPGDPQWRTQGVHRYVGHRVHVEITPKDDRPLEVLKVVDGDPLSDAPALGEPVAPLEGSKPQEAEAAARSIAERFVSSVAKWAKLEAVEERDVADAGLWLFDRRELFVPAAASLDAKLREIAAAHLKEREAVASRIVRTSPLAMTMGDGSGENEFVHIRGSHENLGEEAPRRFLEALAGPEPLPIERGSGRLRLAERFVDPANPFFSRVIVNRVWQHLFGRGIVPTVDDFGVLGQAPSHPELLDRLARDFLDDEERSIKGLVRRLALSSAYRMESRFDPDSEALDPGNRLWHRMPAKRLEGEALRDAMLAVSGRVDSAMYGLPIPLHLTEFMDGRGRPGANGPLDGAGRRTIYQAVRRNFLSPFLAAFDTPGPFSTMGRRNVSNVPAQALILLNDPFVLEQAARFGTRALALPNASPDERIAWMYETAFARSPEAEELALARDFLAREAELRGVSPDDPAVWGDLAHALFNVKEFLFVP